MTPTEDDVWNKEDSTSDVVLVTDKTQVLIHSFNLRISNISSIDVGKQVQDGHDRKKSKVNLNQLARCDARRIWEPYLSHDLLASFAFPPAHEVRIFRQETRVSVGRILNELVIDLHRPETFAVVVLHGERYGLNDKARWSTLR